MGLRFDLVNYALPFKGRVGVGMGLERRQIRPLFSLL